MLTQVKHKSLSTILPDNTAEGFRRIHHKLNSTALSRSTERMCFQVLFQTMDATADSATHVTRCVSQVDPGVRPARALVHENFAAQAAHVFIVHF